MSAVPDVSKTADPTGRRPTRRAQRKPARISASGSGARRNLRQPWSAQTHAGRQSASGHRGRVPGARLLRVRAGDRHRRDRCVAPRRTEHDHTCTGPTRRDGRRAGSTSSGAEHDPQPLPTRQAVIRPVRWHGSAGRDIRIRWPSPRPQRPRQSTYRSSCTQCARPCRPA